MKKLILLLTVSLFILACQEEKKETTTTNTLENTKKETKKEKTSSPEERFAKSIERSHQISNFESQKMVQFNLDLSFGGEETMKAKITMLTNSGKIKVEKSDGSILIYDGEKVSLFPEEKNYEKARFDMFTWAYFFSLPFKLTDPGTQWQELQERKMNDIYYDTAKLTFAKKTGDAPDDWYVVYANQNTKLLKAAAYIVTLGKDLATAEENPHAIIYDNYFSVKQVAFAKEWTFFNWSEEKGIYGEAIGKGMISNVNFTERKEDFFKAPNGSIEIKK